MALRENFGPIAAWRSAGGLPKPMPMRLLAELPEVGTDSK
jgi:hypothetical protein